MRIVSISLTAGFFLLLTLATAFFAKSNVPLQTGTQPKYTGAKTTADAAPSTANDLPYKNFRLHYASIGLGSNFGSKQPVFNAVGTKFTYLLMQTSYYEGEKRKKNDTIKIGELSRATIDSIIYIAAHIKDSAVYKVDPSVMSGGIDEIRISWNHLSVNFHLVNSSDSSAQKIVAILNAYLPDTVQKLFIEDYHIKEQYGSNKSKWR